MEAIAERAAELSFNYLGQSDQALEEKGVGESGGTDAQRAGEEEP